MHLPKIVQIQTSITVSINKHKTILINSNSKSTIPTTTTWLSKQPNQFSEQAKEVTAESKGFFKSAFVDPDREIKSIHTFSFKLLGSLLAIGLILIAIILFLAIPEEVSLFTSEAKIVFLSFLA